MPELLSNKRKRPSDEVDELITARNSHSFGDQTEDKSLERPLAKRRLRIVTDVASLTHLTASPSSADLSLDSETDSLFDADSLFDDTSSPRSACLDQTTATSELTSQSATPAENLVPARRTAPLIPGLFFDEALLLPEDLAEDVMWTCIRTYFQSSSADQVMLFERAPSPSPEHDSPPRPGSSGLPPVLTDLLVTLSALLRPLLPPTTHALLFPPPSAAAPRLARQAILNLYWPGEGITPHVDLLDRYGDGVIGVSLGSGCVMQFERVRNGEEDGGEGRERWGVYLPPRSVFVLSEEARYAWTHGIEKRMDDLVEHTPGGAGAGSSWIERDVRLSITFRWLLPGADVVGGPDASEDV
ncbi:hypothetical protein SCP_0214950 [Sparassis crispa]|uniref:Fe2OG dioxygenase domain-containing protein n=1 Tax=Sparassis crispa TaxID=139825 RepID=A0A401GDM1_9APHY|nr:hypothetical protein SCP_0214950 [Sparassis crispa]GBE80276.1 hypothetical protein SCP_0214950 [Sparassis crispa]